MVGRCERWHYPQCLLWRRRQIQRRWLFKSRRHISVERYVSASVDRVALGDPEGVGRSSSIGRLTSASIDPLAVEDRRRRWQILQHWEIGVGASRSCSDGRQASVDRFNDGSGILPASCCHPGLQGRCCLNPRHRYLRYTSYRAHKMKLTVYLDTGSGKHRQLINISELAELLGEDYCGTLLGLYVFSGEDCTSAFKGKWGP